MFQFITTEIAMHFINAFLRFTMLIYYESNTISAKVLDFLNYLKIFKKPNLVVLGEL
jgi:hypothetical protein